MNRPIRTACAVIRRKRATGCVDASSLPRPALQVCSPAGSAPLAEVSRHPFHPVGKWIEIGSLSGDSDRTASLLSSTRGSRSSNGNAGRAMVLKRPLAATVMPVCPCAGSGYVAIILTTGNSKPAAGVGMEPERILRQMAGSARRNGGATRASPMTAR